MEGTIGGGPGSRGQQCQIAEVTQNLKLTIHRGTREEYRPVHKEV